MKSQHPVVVSFTVLLVKFMSHSPSNANSIVRYRPSVLNSNRHNRALILSL
jgi:hypothetical protein